MKKITILAFSLVSIIACNNNGTQTQQTTTDSQKDTVPATKTVGGDIDEHGCKASAGYTWSSLKNDCIRLFETGIKLTPQDSSINKTTVSYIILNADNTKAELFLPTEKKSILLTRTGGEGTPWENSGWSLIPWKGYILKKDGKLLFAGK